MILTLQDALRERIEHAPQQYHQLIILLHSTSQPVDFDVKEMADEFGCGYINLGLELSQALLDLTERQRALKLPRLVDQITNRFDGKPVLLDHIEVLFEPELKQDPLRLLQGLSRNRIILAIWNGPIVKGNLTYALPDHPEYRRYPVQDLNILSLLDYSM
jgi:hypothetical protein